MRDLALAHVRAAELPDAGGKRFFVTAGDFSNKEVAEAISEGFPEYKSNLPADLSGGDYQPGRPKYDNSRVREVLDIDFIGLKKSIQDTARSLKDIPE